MQTLPHQLGRPVSERFTRAAIAARLRLLALPLAMVLGACTEGDGDRIRRSVYVALPSGTQLAVDAWLPAGAGPDEPVPTVLRPTTSWRDFEMRLRPGIDRPIGWTVDRWNEAGYALVIFDVPGTGASFGSRTDRDPDQDGAAGIRIVDWIIEQPWSSGQVAVWGEQDDAPLVEPLLASWHSAIGAGILRYTDWDLRAHRHAPGGIPLEPVIEERRERALALNVGDPCGFSPRDCDEVAPVFLGPRPVQADSDGAQRDAALVEHGKGDDLENRAQSAEESLGGSDSDIYGNPSPHLAATRLCDAGVPTQVWAGWWESETADAALRRYAEVSAPQMLIIGAFGPGGATRAAPGQRVPPPAEPAPTEQFAAMAAFVDRHMLGKQAETGGVAGASDGADGADEASNAGVRLSQGSKQNAAADWSRVDGYALELTGEGWLEGSGEPPIGEDVSYALSNEGRLTPSAGPGPIAAARNKSKAAEGASEAQLLTHVVDFSVGTGTFGRYLGRLESRLAWPDRAAQDERLLYFDADSLAADMRILGKPRLDLEIGFEVDPGRDKRMQIAALHAYLETVAPSGRVDLLSEGHLLLEDERMQPRWVELSPIGIRVPAGMRLRLSLAGHDVDAFERIPANGNVRWQIDPQLSTLSVPELDAEIGSAEADGD